MKTLLRICLVLWSAHALATPDIQTWKTENGAKVLFVNAPELPMVDIRLAFDAGSARDTKPGLATLTNGTLAEGAGGLSAVEISERFDELGASFSSGASRDIAYVALRSLTDPDILKPALENFALVITKPEFPAEDFEREKQRTLIGLQQKQQDPGNIAQDTFYAELFGKHPYALPPEGDENSVKALTVDDAKAFYQGFYTAENAVIAIVGDLSREQAENTAKTIIADLPSGKRLSPIATTIAPKGVDKKINFPSSQSHIFIGQLGMSRLDPEFFPLYVGNHVLGGSGLVSRLAEEIREKRGLSYSVYSYFLPLRVNGPFLSGLETRNEQATQASELLKKTLQRYIDEGPKEDELSAAKDNLVGGFPLRIDSNSEIVEYLVNIGFYDLPLDYLKTFVDKVAAVTRSDIQSSFNKRLDTNELVMVTVGGEAKPGAKVEPLPKEEAGSRHLSGTN